MAITRAQFYTRHDVFDLTDDTDPLNPVPNPVEDAKVDAAIAASEAQVDRTLFKTSAMADECIMFLVAHKLACDPTSVNARIQKSRGQDNLHTSEDIYWKEYVLLARVVAGGAWVVR